MNTRDLLRRIACALTGAALALAQSLGLYLVSSNLANIQGSIGASAAEASWLTTAFFAAVLSSTLLLAKIRLHFGLARVATIGLVAFIAAATLHLATNTVASAILARVLLGMTAPMTSTLGVFYLGEAFAPRWAIPGSLMGFCFLQLGLPFSRVISPELLELGQWHGLFMIDVALALVSLAAMHVVHLTPLPLQPSLNRGDLLTFPLYAAGLALLTVAISQGRLYWWTDTGWIGECLAGSIALIGLYVAIDLGRAKPLLDLRWLFSPRMIRFVVAVILFRVILSEQTIGVVGLMTVLGQANEQMQTLFALSTAAIFVGFVASILMAARGGTRLLGLVAVALIVAAAWLDSTSTALTRPEQLYASQVLISLGLAVFFAGAVLLGFGPVLAGGSREMASFLAAFTFAQYLGSLVGTAWVSTLVAWRQQFHYAVLAEQVRIGDPLSASRLAQASGALAHVVADTAARAAQGSASLVQQVTRESFVLAYDDVFTRIAQIGCCMFVGLAASAWWMARPASATVAAASGERAATA